MNFPTALKVVVIQKYMSFFGRARRAEFWWFYLFTMVLARTTEKIDWRLYLATVVIFMIPTFAVTTRRLHDLDYRGWWQIIPYAFLLGGMAVGHFAAVVVGLVVFVGFLVCLGTPGTKGPNRFGDDPLEGGSDQVEEVKPPAPGSDRGDPAP
ncbi:MAG: DUF805 domain-containing protein [Methylobacteriaceae bacterium]|jgi:uncharacterized membrane protein YhaH (DUF805 family)|nr:DUF805 domain-containing protein [Methylobacteriaceae bacterium]